MFVESTRIAHSAPPKDNNRDVSAVGQQYLWICESRRLTGCVLRVSVASMSCRARNKTTLNTYKYVFGRKLHNFGRHWEHHNFEATIVSKSGKRPPRRICSVEVSWMTPKPHMGWLTRNLFAFALRIRHSIPRVIRPHVRGSERQRERDIRVEITTLHQLN